jgi:hypothetical protein
MQIADRNEGSIEGGNEEPIANDPSGIQMRYERAIRGLEKPISSRSNPAFRNISIKERGERLLAVELLAQEYLSAEQITDFLPAFGLSVPLSRVYTYLAMVRLPKRYKQTVERRSRRLHDGLSVSHLIRLARDAREIGLAIERVQVARKLPDVPVIPDAYFFLRCPKAFGYFLEEQIAPLPDTRWRDKLRAYLKRRLKTKDNIRVLFVVNDRGDMARARAYARELLRDHESEGMKLFLFAEQLTLKGSRNVVSAPVWLTPWGNAVSLVSWMGLPGGSPTVQC